MTFNSVIFSFLVILGDFDLKKFFNKSKTSSTVFFWDALQYITWKTIKNSEGYRQVDLGWNAPYTLLTSSKIQ